MNKYKRLLVLLCAVNQLEKKDLPLKCEEDIIPSLKQNLKDEITAIETINKIKDKK